MHLAGHTDLTVVFAHSCNNYLGAKLLLPAPKTISPSLTFTTTVSFVQAFIKGRLDYSINLRYVGLPAQCLGCLEEYLELVLYLATC